MILKLPVNLARKMDPWLREKKICAATESLLGRKLHKKNVCSDTVLCFMYFL